MPWPIHVLALAGLSLMVAGNPVQICSQVNGLGQSAPNRALLQMDKELAMQTVVLRDPGELANRSELVQSQTDPAKASPLNGLLHEELRDWSVKSLCIVGNGPLSEHDHMEIGFCPADQLIRFNGMVNLLQGEAVGHLYANAYPDGWWGVTRARCDRVHQAKEVVLFGEGAKAQASKASLRQRYGVKIVLGIDDGEHISVDGKNFATHNSNYGFSVGFKGIAYARWRYPSARLEIYGFNWNAIQLKENRDLHPFEIEKEAVANMTNVRIHPTPAAEKWHGTKERCDTGRRHFGALLEGGTNVTEAWSLWAGETLDDL